MGKIKNNKYVFYWEVGGIFFLIIFGSILHFIYEWFSYPIIGIFSPVNESVWEHLKLGYWSLFLFSILEYRYIKDKVNNFIVAKALGIFTLQLFIIVFYYSYTSILGKNILVLDILSYIIGSISCQIISYKILMYRKLGYIATIISICFIITHAFALAIFTFYPPKLPIFKDNRTGQYGIGKLIDYLLFL
ncbi:DUF6512 family protein [Thermohalobacter berrensis]|uniref:Uncharacterized protein n=1 Tax=Thermohalobacter berrensis TaxID=99594 RepID=A0A419TB26_9FIRM|nr:DUF6512 family protein [Thermohalobacter berrensis]RKD34694.1 hypothetical protein BET03_02390 [Thermohalobacter berrensis]